jgi:hypothetical protein
LRYENGDNSHRANLQENTANINLSGQMCLIINGSYRDAKKGDNISMEKCRISATVTNRKETRMKTTATIIIFLSVVAITCAQQQNNIVINNNNSIVMLREVQQQPHIVFQSSFQTSVGNDFESSWIGNKDFVLWVGENRSHFGLEAYIFTKDDIKHGRRGSALFTLPRDVNAAARMLQANGWKYRYSSGGYNLTLVIESIWRDGHYIPRCKGYVVVTGDPRMIQSSGDASDQTSKQLDLLERLSDLHKKGILTDDEFKRKKAEILDN